MNSRILTLVHSWLVIDFFGDSRRTGEPGSSLTSTVFTQSFIGLVFAAVFLPETTQQATAYITANLSLSTILIGIGLLGDPKRARRELADEYTVFTAPLPPSALTLARVLHTSFYLCLVTTGMAIPPAVLAYWATGGDLLVVPFYLVMASVVAGLLAGAIAVLTRLVHVLLGPARAQLVAGTLKATLLGGGFVGFALCLPHLAKTADALPIGRAGAMLWPPYWAAQAIQRPLDAASAWILLAATAAALFAAGTVLQRMRRRRVLRPAGRASLLSRLDGWLAGAGPLLGVTRFVATMLYRSPGFRGRVLPLFGMPAAMVMLSLWDLEDARSRALLLGMTLQFPAIFLPFLVAFLPRSDREKTAWIFDTCPHREMPLYRAGSLIALTTHVLLPVQLTAAAALLVVAGATGEGLLFAITMPMFSLALGVVVAEISLTRLETPPFTEDAEGAEDTMEFGGLSGIAIGLAILGGGFSVVASDLLGLAIALAGAVLALQHVRRKRHKLAVQP